MYWLRELFEFEVYGIELDPISSEYAKKLIEPDHIFVGHTENAPFIDGSFDLVIMNQVIEHLPDPATVLHATKKALKPKGALYITTPNFGGISFRFLKDKWKNTCPNDHISMFSVKSLHRYLHDAGFKNLIVRIHRSIHHLTEKRQCGIQNYTAKSIGFGYKDHWEMSRLNQFWGWALCLRLERIKIRFEMDL